MAKKKKHKTQRKAGLGRKGGKQAGGGEPKKPGKTPRVAAMDSEASVAEAKDAKRRSNIGPSGQGTHRGRERSNRQTGVSGRPDIPSVGGKGRRAR